MGPARVDVGRPEGTDMDAVRHAAKILHRFAPVLERAAEL
jgi:hypothetical protein